MNKFYPDVDAYIVSLNRGHKNGVHNSDHSSVSQSRGSDVSNHERSPQEVVDDTTREPDNNLQRGAYNPDSSSGSERTDSGYIHLDRSEHRRDTRPTGTREVGIDNKDYGTYPSITGADHLHKPSLRQTGGTHYKKYAIQPSEYNQKNKLNHLESNVVKYVTRHSDKGGPEDIKKAIHCLELILEWEYRWYD